LISKDGGELIQKDRARKQNPRRGHAEKQVGRKPGEKPRKKRYAKRKGGTKKEEDLILAEGNLSAEVNPGPDPHSGLMRQTEKGLLRKKKRVLIGDECCPWSGSKEVRWPVAEGRADEGMVGCEKKNANGDGKPLGYACRWTQHLRAGWVTKASKKAGTTEATMKVLSRPEIQRGVGIERNCGENGFYRRP